MASSHMITPDYRLISFDLYRSTMLIRALHNPLEYYKSPPAGSYVERNRYETFGGCTLKNSESL